MTKALELAQNIFIFLFLTLLAVGGFVTINRAVLDATDSQGIAECAKWMQYATEYPTWGATNAERSQCEYYGLDLPPNRSDIQSVRARQTAKPVELDAQRVLGTQ